MVQRVGDVEESSNVRTGEAQDVARQAMEETRKEVNPVSLVVLCDSGMCMTTILLHWRGM